MANVKGKEVSDGSHNVVYRAAVGSEIANLTVQSVSTGENVKYKIAGVGELANAIVTISGGSVSIELVDDVGNILTDDLGNTLII
jgi:hypothetical protein